MNSKQVISKTASTNEEANNSEEKRLWIGNLDPRVNDVLKLSFDFANWYQLLKLMQQHGNIEKFDLLFHRSGPLAGQPRGYAFVTYVSRESAITAKNILHNKLIGNRHITVTWAHSISNDEPDKKKAQMEIPALAGAKVAKKTSRETQIQAIEAKLKMMENRTYDDFEINKTVASETPVLTCYQQKAIDAGQNTHKHKYSHRRNHFQPYHNKTKRR